MRFKLAIISAACLASLVTTAPTAQVGKKAFKNSLIERQVDLKVAPPKFFTHDQGNLIHSISLDHYHSPYLSFI
jgi:hypothetical protein